MKNVLLGMIKLFLSSYSAGYHTRPVVQYTADGDPFRLDAYNIMQGISKATIQLTVRLTNPSLANFEMEPTR